MSPDRPSSPGVRFIELANPFVNLIAPIVAAIITCCCFNYASKSEVEELHQEADLQRREVDRLREDLEVDRQQRRDSAKEKVIALTRQVHGLTEELSAAKLVADEVRAAAATAKSAAEPKRMEASAAHAGSPLAATIVLSLILLAIIVWNVPGCRSRCSTALLTAVAMRRDLSARALAVAGPTVEWLRAKVKGVQTRLRSWWN